ncbi:MAG TPA: RluA family pseudouridine synthase [Rickettsiales bacterium]|nr:RluA family pseudouridine synthase [Rickettsiales bacterium]
MNQYTVEEADGDIRLDRWFKRHRPDVPHGMLEKALRKGDIRLEGKKAKASDRVQQGQTITIRFLATPPVAKEEKSTPKPQKTTPEDAKMLQDAVLYKDADIIVINKPPGLAVQGGSKITRSVDGMLDALRFDAKERPKLVHRLDRDTSGVLVLARSAKAATKLMHAFARKEAEKIYWALIKGAPEIPQGKIDLPLAKQEDGDIEKVNIDEEDGKRAITYYRVLERLGKTLSWVELMPVTGRTHQLRVHMSAIGHPILGDGKYGAREAFIDGMELSRKLHLHARRIVIPGLIDVTAPLPRHMEQSWETLGLDQ